MSRRRPSSTPPVLRGFEYRAHLGSGGFADVFLYADNAANRDVAVKVLLQDSLAPGVRQQFESEARLMGRLSSHPSIVTVFQTGIAGDGRPYLVMEYCPRPNLGARFRTQRMSVPEALDLIVDICGAVETAHRAGILHRDIKPANILVTDYERAVLTDFGIAATIAAQHENQGMSVPWAPPEFAEGRGWPASDVWSLAATLYSLLAGRAPFEVPGGDNSAATMLHRSANEVLPRLGRTDVPPMLEEVLGVAMAKDPARRFSSALDFGRALQRVQTSMQLPETKIYVPSAAAPSVTAPEMHGTEAEDDGTRIAGIRSVDPSASRQPAANPAIPMGFTVVPAPRVQAAEDVSATQMRGPQPGAVHSRPALAATPRKSGRAFAVAGAAAVVLAVAGGGAWWLSQGTEDEAVPAALAEEVPSAAPAPARASDQVPAIAEAVGVLSDGGARFTWANPDPRPGDSFRWVRTGTAANETPQEGAAPEAFIPDVEQACISVSVVRETGKTTASGTQVCAP